MKAPPILLADLDDEALQFWIEETPETLIDTVTEKVMMEELMQV